MQTQISIDVIGGTITFQDQTGARVDLRTVSQHVRRDRDGVAVTGIQVVVDANNLTVYPAPQAVTVEGEEEEEQEKPLGPFTACAGGCNKGEYYNRADERGWLVSGPQIYCPDCTWARAKRGEDQ